MSKGEYLILSTEINTRNGPTFMGNENSNADLMCQLGGELKSSKSDLQSKVWENTLDIAQVMEIAKAIGYRLASSSGIGQTLVVIMEKIDDV